MPVLLEAVPIFCVLFCLSKLGCNDGMIKLPSSSGNIAERFGAKSGNSGHAFKIPAFSFFAISLFGSALTHDRVLMEALIL